MTDDESTVRVAVRIRPQLAREVIDMCRVCTTVTPGEPQVIIGSDKSFTYDYVFDTDSGQETVFSSTIAQLVAGSLNGYNATVLAYGQTGSGKTYTMGTGFEVGTDPEQTGIIPRAIHMLFEGIASFVQQAVADQLPPPQFKVTAQFLELYNEEIFDLFDASHDDKGKSNIKIHEDSEHSIYVTGVRSERVGSAEEALGLLKKGALSRTTASTQMNCQSSRSHAIFTLHVRQQRLVQVEDEEYQQQGQKEFETLTAKFHFVDLAGSERLKRTGATGERAKEGIAINCGLLALGNVISALGDRAKKALHVPYRDSKLTRLLQDSLGGNSRTLMIACVSPSDRDFMETLNTLKYANRARNIQNKVVINQDKSSRTISLLKKEIQQLQLELLEYKQGKRIIGEDGNEAVNDMFHENKLLQSELEALRTRLKGMQETIESLTARNTELLTERDVAAWAMSSDGTKDDMSQMIKGYLTEIEGMRAKLVESESIVVQLRKEMSRAPKFSFRNDNSSLSESGIEEVLDIAKRDVLKDLDTIRAKQVPPSSEISPSDSESSSSETEEDLAGGQLSADIADLTSEITVKQRLIEALENTNKRLNLMKQQYEEKLMLLQAKISATEKERDTVLASYSNMESKQPSEKVKKIKDDYEKRLYDMQREMKSLLSAKKEHAKLLRNQSQYENQIRQLNADVQEMKRNKVRLMKKMREEAQRYKEVETRAKRELAQLKKKTRQDATVIKNLEAEKKAKAIVLKRKQEEVSALRKAAQGRKFGRRHNQSSQAKHHWISLEKNIAEMAMSRQTAISLEKEMEKKIESRTDLQEEMNTKLAMLNDPRFKNSLVLSEEVDSVRASLDHVQSAISDLQHEILQVEESKAAFESDDLLRLFVDIGEAPYMLEKLYSMALHSSCMNAEKDATLRELQAENEQLKRESEMQEQLLKHLVEGKAATETGSSPPSSVSSRSTSPQPDGRKKRPQRKALAPFDLLFPAGSVSVTQPKKGSNSATASPERLAPPPLLRSLTTIKVPNSAPGSPVVLRKQLSVSPKLTRRQTYVISSSNYPSMERGLELAGSPPGSPPQYRRQTSREENVFSRLTSQQPSTTRHPGKITSFTFRKNLKTPIFCTHVVEGHSRAVLAVHATEENLFTASRDRSVLVWDLRLMREVEMFGGHPNNVVAVKYDPGLKLVFAASSSFVKVWDLRSAKCIRTLFSSGMSASWSNQQNNNGDPQMNDIALGENGFALYTAAGDKVRVWDLRKFSVTGKLIGGHQAAVMCLSVGPGVVATGSKDHYIKLFDLDGADPPVGVLSPRVTLDPPHYDGIECLQLSGDILFSGSRDGIIKKWSIDTPELLCSLNGAHKDWVTGLCRTNGGLLASGCRDGTVKLWSPESCTLVGEVKAHSSAINALASNSNHLFTASNSGDVRMWRESLEQDIMTMSTGHMLQLSV